MDVKLTVLCVIVPIIPTIAVLSVQVTVLRKGWTVTFDICETSQDKPTLIVETVNMEWMTLSGGIPCLSLLPLGTFHQNKYYINDDSLCE